MGALSDFLIQDHERLDALMARAVRDPGRIDDEAYAEFREGLLRHIGIEEKILMLDAKTRRGGEPLPMAAQIRLEHSAIALLLVPTPTHAILAELRWLLEQHNPREEGPDGLYAICESLAGEEASLLLERAKSAPKVPVAKHYDGPRAHRTAASALEYAKTKGGKEE